jgi:GPH family glycoside/pentoside/hexuronide:cation symporter
MSSAAPHSTKVPKSERVPLREKIAYGLGNVGAGIQENAEKMVMNPVFVIGVGISPAVMSLLSVVYRLWDAVTDLTMGWVSDNFRSRWGRRRPFIFAGAIIMGMVMPLVFFYNESWSITTITAWLFGCSLLLYTCLTVFNVPYQSLLLEITPNSNERTNVAAVRAYLGMSVQFVMTWMWWATQLPIFHVNGEANVLNGTRWIICVLAIAVIVLGLLPAFFCKERYYETAKHQEKLSIWKNLKLTFRNGPFVLIMAIVLVFTVGLNLKWGLDFFTKLFYVCQGDQGLASQIQGIQGTLQIFLSLAGIPIFQWISNHKGKVFALITIVVLVTLASLSTWFCYTPAYPYLSMLPVFFIGPAVSAIWVIIPSMVGDIVDYDELKNGERREGAFSAIFSWNLKLAWSLAGGISGVLVVWAGYQAEVHKEIVPDNILLNMRLMLTWLPALLIAPTIYMVWKYPLTAKRVAEIREELEARRGKIGES